MMLDQMSTDAPRGEIEPFYFGASEKLLFGCYHAPLVQLTRACAVVLSYPMGAEYIRSHRAFRQLAARLSRAGFPVLRFDYYGCGDSYGDFEEGGLRQWAMDLSTAIEALRERHDGVSICTVGLRLGATLSMMIAAERGAMDSMVLWNPVIDGRAYLQELKTWQQDRLEHFSPAQAHSPESMEILGFPLPDSLRMDLEHLHLLAIQQKPARNVLILENHEGADTESLRAHLEHLGTHVDYQRVHEPRIWAEDVNKALVPRQTLQQIVSWMGEVYS
jgi:alpha-beta hydrolase superfamily lysophospholipase